MSGMGMRKQKFKNVLKRITQLNWYKEEFNDDDKSTISIKSQIRSIKVEKINIIKIKINQNFL